MSDFLAEIEIILRILENASKNSNIYYVQARSAYSRRKFASSE